MHLFPRWTRYYLECAGLRYLPLGKASCKLLYIQGCYIQGGNLLRFHTYS